MKLFTNSNNINSLKLLVSSSLAKLDMDVVYVSPTKDSKDTLPVLEVGGSKLFMPGSAAVFLMQEGGMLREEELHQLETLLEWEATTLYPVVVSLLQHKQAGDQVIMTQLRSLLAVMEDTLVKQEHLAGSSLSVVDVLVWCDLYPVMTDTRMRKELAKLTKTCSWFDRLGQNTSFSSSLAKFSTGMDGCRTASLSLLSLHHQAKTAPLCSLGV